MDINVLATDREKEQKGVWVSIGSGARVRVGRATNPKYRAALTKYQKKFCGLKVDPSSPDFEKAVIHAMAEELLFDWDGLEKDGKPFPYSKENAHYLLENYPDFREVVSKIALDSDNFRPDDVIKK